MKPSEDINEYATDYKSLIYFTIPSIAATMVEPLVEIVDSAIIGPISPNHLSALSANGAIFALSLWIFNFLVHVGSAEVAAAASTGNRQQLREGVFLSLGLPIIIGLIVASILFAIGDFLLEKSMGLQDQRLLLAYDYYYVRILSVPFALLLSSACGVLRGLGLVKQAFSSVLLMTVINVSLTLYLVKIVGLGLKGAAIGSLISLVITSLPISYYLYATFLKDSFWLIAKKIDVSYLKSYISNSTNQFLRTLAISSSFFIATSVANASSATVGAAHQILLHYWLLASYVLDGFSVTATTIGANLWFSSKRKEWIDLARKLLVLSLIVGILFSTVYLLFPNLVLIFTRSDTVFNLSMKVWILIALFQIPNSILYTYDGLFFSQKNFGYIRKKIWEGFIFLFLPIIYFFGHKELFFIWLAVCALNLYRFIAFTLKLYQLSKSIETSS